MKAYLLKRLFSMGAVLLVVATVAFLLLFLAPGDPVSLLLGDSATDQAIANLRQQMGWDRPFWYRVVIWFSRIGHGDLGRSLFFGVPVAQLLVARLEPSLLLSTIGTFVAVALSIPLGVAAATTRDRLADRVIMGGSVLGMSIPPFWLSLNLILLFRFICVGRPCLDICLLQRIRGKHSTRLCCQQHESSATAERIGGGWKKWTVRASW